jgi:phosphate transport system protein
MKKFEQELESLKQQVMEMGEVAESMVGWASAALAGRDRALILKVQASEPKLDRYQIEIDSEAIRLITIYTPIAKDLRFLLMVARINTELERIGDQALNNSEYVLQMLSAPPAQPLRDLSKMSEPGTWSITRCRRSTTRTPKRRSRCSGPTMKLIR